MISMQCIAHAALLASSKGAKDTQGIRSAANLPLILLLVLLLLLLLLLVSQHMAYVYTCATQPAGFIHGCEGHPQNPLSVQTNLKIDVSSCDVVNGKNGKKKVRQSFLEQ